MQLIQRVDRIDYVALVCPNSLKRVTEIRTPTVALLAAHVGKDPKTRTQAIQDLMWAVLNTKEFMFNH